MFFTSYFSTAIYLLQLSFFNRPTAKASVFVCAICNLFVSLQCKFSQINGQEVQSLKTTQNKTAKRVLVFISFPVDSIIMF